MRPLRLLSAIALTIAMLALPGSHGGAPASTDAERSTFSVTVGAESITVTGAGGGGSDGTTIELYELAPYETIEDLPALSPIAADIADSATYRITVDRWAPQAGATGPRDRYYSKFVVAKRPGGDGPLTVLFGPRFGDAEFPARYSAPYPEARSKKGLQVQMLDDGEELGIGHAAINVVTDVLMMETPVEGDTIEHDVDGQTYYFRKGQVENIDREVRMLSDNGVLVNAVLLHVGVDLPNSPNRHLIHPDAHRGQGIVYAFNAQNAEGIRYLKAMFEFLADRYSRDDESHGRVAGWVVGNEVNSQYVWQNQGDTEVGDFVTNYHRVLRLASQALRKSSESARAYVSLDSNWAKSHDPAAPTRFYPGKEIIDLLASTATAEGDFPWHVAFHPYASSLMDVTRIWEDPVPQDSPDSPVITFKNLDVLTEYLEQDELLYRGSPRRVNLTEVGFHTASSADGEAVQAAAYAYAYYRTAFLRGVDAFILHRHVDHQHEGGLLLGLWTRDEARPEPDAPGRPKRIYDVFARVDTAESLDATAFAKEIIGISDWSEVIPGFDPALLERRPRATQLTAAAPAPIDALSTQEAAYHADFELGPGAWQRAENTHVVTYEGDVEGSGTVRSGIAALGVHSSGVAKTWRGAYVELDEPLDATGADRLQVAVKLRGHDPSRPYEVQLRAYGSDGGAGVAYGQARLENPGSWTIVSFDVGAWSGRASLQRLKVWVRSAGSADWVGVVLLDDVMVARHRP